MVESGSRLLRKEEKIRMKRFKMKEQKDLNWWKITANQQTGDIHVNVQSDVAYLSQLAPSGLSVSANARIDLALMRPSFSLTNHILLLK
jgi:hypothetical protein